MANVGKSEDVFRYLVGHNSLNFGKSIILASSSRY